MADSKQRADSCQMHKLIVFNRYVLFMCVTYELTIISQVANVANMIFVGAAPRVIGCGDKAFPSNMTQQEACHMYTVMSSDNSTCVPSIQSQFTSVNVDWNLLCDDEHYVKTSISYQMLGVMIGALLFGQLSDLYGRKPIAMSTVLGSIVSGSVSAFTNSLLSFTIMRFIVGVFVGGNSTVMYVYVIENVPHKARFKLKTFVTWSPNLVLLSLVAYCTGEWRSLSLVMNLLSAPALLCFMFLYESPCWLLHKGRINTARSVLTKISLWGRRTTTTTTQFDQHPPPTTTLLAAGPFTQEEEKKMDSPRYYLHHLLASRELLLHSAVMSFTYWSMGAISVSLMFNLEKISGSLYMNTAILGLFRYVFNMFVALADHRFDWLGRKATHTLALVGILFGIAVILLVRLFGTVLYHSALVRGCTLLAVGMTSTVMLVNGITTAELFPTPVRNVAIAHALTWGRIGSIIAPTIFYLSVLHSAVPYGVLVSMALLDMILFAVFLPETKNKPMHDHMPSPNQHLLAACCLNKQTLTCD